MRASFAEFVLDTATRQLTRAGREVHLEPKALELLELLVARRPEAVAKTEVHERLWPGTFVSESNLTGLVAQVRRALRDDRRQERFIRTLHGFGYAFVGAVGRESRSLPGKVIWEDQVTLLQPGENVLGRAENATVRIDAPGVSRRHARIVVQDGQVTIEDLGSKNGTFVGERRLEVAATLNDGDTFRLGRQLLVFRRSGPAAATSTEGA
jgi:DNA-binding winged helix-turn-helix (wHTH) protein